MLPTATQTPDSGQETPARLAMPDGTDSGDHVDPPLFEKMTGVLPEPTATQSEADQQDTLKSEVIPFGSDGAVHVCPPFEVSTMSDSSPMAMQLLLVEQSTSDKSKAWVTSWLVQLVIPVVVRNTRPVDVVDSPTATHSVVETQDTEVSPADPLGRDSSFHVIPPFVVPSTMPVLLSEVPTARHSLVDGQAIPASSCIPNGAT